MAEELDPNASLGRYRLLRRLGAGAMGEVYLADDPQIERRLAVKTVRLEGDSEEVEERKQRLLREAKTAGRLLHPNVVTLFDAGEDDGVVYLAFEFVDGPDLSRRMRVPPALTLAEILRIARQTASALEAAHRQNIVHRDIKPSNILLTPAGDAKVADFGIAKVLGQQTDLTTTGSVVGSPQYMSPEQIRGEALDGRTDLFSLGTVLYELLTGGRAFGADTITTLVYQILHQEPADVAERRPDLPPSLVRLVRRLMAKSRDARCANATEVVAEIERIERDLVDSGDEETRLLDETVSASIAPAPPPPPAPRASPPPPPTPVPPPASPPAARARPNDESTPPPAARGAAVVTADRRRGVRPWLVGVAVALVVGVVAVGALAAWLLLRSPQAESLTDESPAGVVGDDGEEAAGRVLPASRGEPVAVTDDDGEAEVAARAERSEAASAAVPGEESDRGGEDTAAAAAPGGGEEAPSPRATSVSSRDATAESAPSPPAQPAASPRPAAREPSVRTTSPPTVAEPSPRGERGVETPASVETSETEIASQDAEEETLAAEAPAAEPTERELPELPVRLRLETGLELAFDVSPADAFVQFRSRRDRRFIQPGQAKDFNGRRGRVLKLPQPGYYLIRLRAQDHEDYVIGVDAAAGRPQQTIEVRMSAGRSGAVRFDAPLRDGGGIEPAVAAAGFFSAFSTAPVAMAGPEEATE